MLETKKQMSRKHLAIGSVIGGLLWGVLSVIFMFATGLGDGPEFHSPIIQTIFFPPYVAAYILKGINNNNEFSQNYLFPLAMILSLVFVSAIIYLFCTGWRTLLRRR